MLLTWHAGAVFGPGSRPWRGWLTDAGSLTRRLQAACGAFRVLRLSQGLRPPNRDERHDLAGGADPLAAPALRPRQHALVREVLLLCGNTPLVFAHTVAPLPGLEGPWRPLIGLGNRPLGAALFANPRIRRHALTWRRLDRRHPLFRAASRHLTPAPRVLWARRSRFTLAGHGILVTEVFLPAILHLPAAP